MEFSFSAEDELFREEVRTWLAEHLVGEFAALGTGSDMGGPEELGVRKVCLANQQDTARIRRIISLIGRVAETARTGGVGVRRSFVITVVALLAGVFGPGLATAEDEVDPFLDCNADVGDPSEGSVAWDLAERSNWWCSHEGTRTMLANPAYHAAQAANAATGGVAIDPFRESQRWVASGRGTYQKVVGTGAAISYLPPPAASAVADAGEDTGLHSLELFGPPESAVGPFPVVIGGTAELGLAQMETLAEAGYVVFNAGLYFELSPSEAADFIFSTPNNPYDAGTGLYNPWWQRVDRKAKLGIWGFSGGATTAIFAGNSDPRFGAAVSYDRSRGDDYRDTPNTPTLFFTHDYGTYPVMGSDGGEPPVGRDLEYYHTRPEETARQQDFDHFRAHGMDSMLVATRASHHPDSQRGGQFSLYGEQVENYYLLAWFDRYLKTGAVSEDALDRLTATTFDDSVDVHSIGSGHFDPYQAHMARSIEAGNKPIKIEDISVRNRLSFIWPSRYSLTGERGTKLECLDMQAGCPLGN